MSYFRPGGRNKTHLVRPMVELQSESGYLTSRKLMRWGTRNSLMNDFHVKRPHRHARWKYHEPWVEQRTRRIREFWSRRWKQEVKNTADMALWWKFRVNATESYDIEQYENYLKQREDKRYKEMMKERRYNSWTVNDCIEEKDYISYSRTNSEQEYLNSIQPEAFLATLKENFQQSKQSRIDRYESWKNNVDTDIVNRAQYKKMESNQNIKAKGLNDVRGYDWITYQQNDQSLMLIDGDPEHWNKRRLMRQSNRDKQLINDIINEQNKSDNVE